MVDHKSSFFPLIFPQFLTGGAEAWIVASFTRLWVCEARGRSQEMRLSCSVPVGNYIHCLESTNWRILRSLPQNGDDNIILQTPNFC